MKTKQAPMAETTGREGFQPAPRAVSAVLEAMRDVEGVLGEPAPQLLAYEFGGNSTRGSPGN